MRRRGSTPIVASGSAELAARALEVIRMRADDLAAHAGITRRELDAYALARCETMPFPVRATLAGFLASLATNRKQRRLASLLIQQTVADAGADFVRFAHDVLRNTWPTELERVWNEYLASPLVRHPSAEPTTVAQLAAKANVSVDELLWRVTQ